MRHVMTPEEILAKLKNDSNQRTQNTLDAIYSVCIEQLKNGGTDFSYTTISRIGESLNLPKPQSIRNKSGEKYKTLIDHFKDQSAQKKSKKNKPNEYDWIKKIEDPTSRILINQLISENKKLKSQINEIIPPNALIIIKDNKNGISDNKIDLTPLEVRAVEYLLSESFKSKNSITEDDYGRYVDYRGNIFLPTSTTHAIRKILSIIK